MPDTVPSEPKLAPPGAGVPLPQRLLMRFVLRPFVAERTPWEKSEETFHKLAEKIERELEGLSEEQLSRRVLVPPQTGLEDSSRYWSSAMTLEHIVVVGRQILLLIQELDQGRVPPGMADTARVKPKGTEGPRTSVDAFQTFVKKEFPGLKPALGRKNLKTRFRHPWFGLMNAQGWYWLSATHLGVHLRQLREIRKGL